MSPWYSQACQPADDDHDDDDDDDDGDDDDDEDDDVHDDDDAQIKLGNNRENNKTDNENAVWQRSRKNIQSVVTTVSMEVGFWCCFVAQRRDSKRIRENDKNAWMNENHNRIRNQVSQFAIHKATLITFMHL